MIILEETISTGLVGLPDRNWDGRFIGIAREISSWSKDPSTKVAAIAVNEDRRVVAQGYNGFPAKCDDSKLLSDDRVSKYEMMVHAEANVIYNACNSGTKLSQSTIFIYGMYPCPDCVKALAQVKVARIVFQLGESQNLEKWKNDFDLSRVLMHILGIGFTHYQNLENLQKGLDTYKENWNAHDFPLPEWAIQRSSGNYMQIGAHLATKDGRKHGNAYVDHFENDIAIILTDIGNAMHMRLEELQSNFYPPSYIMDIEEARKKRGINDNID
jgi:dCMP deaminase